MAPYISSSAGDEEVAELWCCLNQATGKLSL